MSEKTTKTCIRCGAALPEEAAFCPVCTASQMERQTMALPRRRRRVWPVAAGCLLLVALALPVGAALWSSTPQAETLPPEDTLPLTVSRESEDGAETRYGELCQTYYEGEDGRLYHVFAAFSPSIDGSSAMQGYRRVMIRPNTSDCGPLTLFVEDAETGQNARGSFYALMEDWDLTITAPDGGDRCAVSDPIFDYTVSTDAMLYQELRGTST